MLHPQIITKGQITLVGLSVLGNRRADIPGLWQRFQQIEPRIRHASDSGRFAIITWGIETELSHNHFLFTGVEVRELEAPPLSAIIKILPAAQYAVFSCRDEAIETTLRHALDVWLDSSTYLEPGFFIQHYDRSRYYEAPQGQRELDLWIPLRRLGGH